MNLEKQYPPPPTNVPAELTEPSNSFRAEMRKVILAIIAFVVTYIVMVALAVALAWLCVKLGLVVMSLSMGVLPVLVGVGIMLMGVLVVFFLVKFLFATSGETAVGGIEITESDEPQLFAFIRKIVGEVGTHFPRKIFLIPDVNASVFYSSSFLSLFFPTKKNLNIGLGLVNALNVSEFKAVMAHEFGHFSQRSMSLGSYVYYVNQVIFNMLYRNTGWISTANTIASGHAILYFFVRMAVFIVQGVQWVLQGMYSIINRQYMSLSREMEFHADTIAASVSGSNNMIQALRQIELGSQTYLQTIDKCNELLPAKKAPANAYVGQRAIAIQLAAVFNLPVQQGLPIVTQDFMAQRQQERINFKNQWASHPTRAEREASLQRHALEAPVVQDSAWGLFQNAEKCQHDLTSFLYREVSMDIQAIDDAAFAGMIAEERLARALPKLYNGYFDGHIIFTEKWPEIEAGTMPNAVKTSVLEAFFTENLDNKILALQQDIETLKAIDLGNVDTKTFDFDGQKHSKDEAAEIQTVLAKELENTLKLRDRRDAEVAAAFYGLALSAGTAPAEKLKNAYRDLQEVAQCRKIFLLHASDILVTVHHIAQNGYNLATDMAQQFRELYNYHVPHLQEMFQKMPSLKLFPEALEKEIREVFLEPGLEFHTYNKPHAKNLERLQALIFETGAFLDQNTFDKQKAVLVMQDGMLANQH